MAKFIVEAVQAVVEHTDRRDPDNIKVSTVAVAPDKIDPESDAPKGVVVIGRGGPHPVADKDQKDRVIIYGASPEQFLAGDEIDLVNPPGRPITVKSLDNTAVFTVAQLKTPACV